MPTLEHDGVVSLFRDNPAFALRVLGEICHVPLPAYASIRVTNASLDQMLPIEFRADLVLEVLDERDRFVLAIVLESQREIDERKKFSWPVYITVSRAERECPAILMVVAVDKYVAEWAQRSIDLGVGKGNIEPVVLGPQTIPEMTDERVARAEVELALLSGMAHGNGTNGEIVLRAALEGISTLDRELAMMYFQILWNVLREPMQKVLKGLVMENRTETEPRIWVYEQILRELFLRDAEVKGFHDGEVKGFQDGEVKGEVKAVREKIFRLAQRRGLVLSDEQQVRLGACDDRITLDRWFDNVIDATSADELFR